VNIKSQKDFFSGAVYATVGAAFAWGATNYTLGEGARMGPGYFPLLLGILLTVIGLAVSFKALLAGSASGDKIGAIAWKPLSFIIGANVLFGILLGGLPRFGIPAMGLIVAIFGVTFVASLAGERFKFKEVLILSVVLALGSYGAFVWGLKLQFPVWPSFIIG
jgi:Tripartite tricarboxylate transporter TctB family